MKDRTLLIVDPTDITKKYAKKMERLAGVRDGSEGAQGLGYWVDTVVGVENGSSEMTPLVNRLYWQNASDFISENRELINCINRVYNAIEGRGIFVHDRGGDRRTLYRELFKLPRKVRFIIRQRGDRHILYKGRLRETVHLAENCKTPYAETVIKVKDGKERAYRIHYGFCPVRLVEHADTPLWFSRSAVDGY